MLYIRTIVIDSNTNECFSKNTLHGRLQLNTHYPFYDISEQSAN